MTVAYGVHRDSMCIAVSTSGGDAFGLNAVIRAVVLGGLNHGWEVLGIRRGFGGLLGGSPVVSLDREDVMRPDGPPNMTTVPLKEAVAEPPLDQIRTAREVGMAMAD